MPLFAAAMQRSPALSLPAAASTVSPPFRTHPSADRPPFPSALLAQVPRTRAPPPGIALPPAAPLGTPRARQSSPPRATADTSLVSAAGPLGSLTQSGFMTQASPMTVAASPTAPAPSLLARPFRTLPAPPPPPALPMPPQPTGAVLTAVPLSGPVSPLRHLSLNARGVFPTPVSPPRALPTRTRTPLPAMVPASLPAGASVAGGGMAPAAPLDEPVAPPPFSHRAAAPPSARRVPTPREPPALAVLPSAVVAAVTSAASSHHRHMHHNVTAVSNGARPAAMVPSRGSPPRPVSAVPPAVIAAGVGRPSPALTRLTASPLVPPAAQLAQSSPTSSAQSFVGGPALAAPDVAPTRLPATTPSGDASYLAQLVAAAAASSTTAPRPTAAGRREPAAATPEPVLGTATGTPSSQPLVTPPQALHQLAEPTTAPAPAPAMSPGALPPQPSAPSPMLSMTTAAATQLPLSGAPAESMQFAVVPAPVTLIAQPTAPAPPRADSTAKAATMPPPRERHHHSRRRAHTSEGGVPASQPAASSAGLQALPISSAAKTMLHRRPQSAVLGHHRHHNSTSTSSPADEVRRRVPPRGLSSSSSASITSSPQQRHRHRARPTPTEAATASAPVACRGGRSTAESAADAPGPAEREFLARTLGKLRLTPSYRRDTTTPHGTSVHPTESACHRSRSRRLSTDASMRPPATATSRRMPLAGAVVEESEETELVRETATRSHARRHPSPVPTSASSSSSSAVLSAGEPRGNEAQVPAGARVSRHRHRHRHVHRAGGNSRRGGSLDGGAAALPPAAEVAAITAAAASTNRSEQPPVPAERAFLQPQPPASAASPAAGPVAETPSAQRPPPPLTASPPLALLPIPAQPPAHALLAPTVPQAPVLDKAAGPAETPTNAASLTLTAPLVQATPATVAVTTPATTRPPAWAAQPPMPPGQLAAEPAVSATQGSKGGPGVPPVGTSSAALLATDAVTATGGARVSAGVTTSAEVVRYTYDHHHYIHYLVEDAASDGSRVKNAGARITDLTGPTTALSAAPAALVVTPAPDGSFLVPLPAPTSVATTAAATPTPLVLRITPAAPPSAAAGPRSAEGGRAPLVVTFEAAPPAFPPQAPAAEDGTASRMATPAAPPEQSFPNSVPISGESRVSARSHSASCASSHRSGGAAISHAGTDAHSSACAGGRPAELEDCVAASEAPAGPHADTGILSALDAPQPLPASAAPLPRAEPPADAEPLQYIASANRLDRPAQRLLQPSPPDVGLPPPPPAAYGAPPAEQTSPPVTAGSLGRPPGAGPPQYGHSSLPQHMQAADVGVGFFEPSYGSPPRPLQPPSVPFGRRSTRAPSPASQHASEPFASAGRDTSRGLRAGPLPPGYPPLDRSPSAESSISGVMAAAAAANAQQPARADAPQAPERLSFDCAPWSPCPFPPHPALPLGPTRLRFFVPFPHAVSASAGLAASKPDTCRPRGAPADLAAVHPSTTPRSPEHVSRPQRPRSPGLATTSEVTPPDAGWVALPSADSGERNFVAPPSQAELGTTVPPAPQAGLLTRRLVAMYPPAALDADEAAEPAEPTEPARGDTFLSATGPAPRRAEDIGWPDTLASRVTPARAVVTVTEGDTADSILASASRFHCPAAAASSSASMEESTLVPPPRHREHNPHHTPPAARAPQQLPPDALALCAASAPAARPPDPAPMRRRPSPPRGGLGPDVSAPDDSDSADDKAIERAAAGDTGGHARVRVVAQTPGIALGAPPRLLYMLHPPLSSPRNDLTVATPPPVPTDALLGTSTNPPEALPIPVIPATPTAPSQAAPAQPPPVPPESAATRRSLGVAKSLGDLQCIVARFDRQLGRRAAGTPPSITHASTPAVPPVAADDLVSVAAVAAVRAAAVFSTTNGSAPLPTSVLLSAAAAAATAAVNAAAAARSRTSPAPSAAPSDATDRAHHSHHRHHHAAAGLVPVSPRAGGDGGSTVSSAAASSNRTRASSAREDATALATAATTGEGSGVSRRSAGVDDGDGDPAPTVRSRSGGMSPVGERESLREDMAERWPV